MLRRLTPLNPGKGFQRKPPKVREHEPRFGMPPASPRDRAYCFGLDYGEWLRAQGCAVPGCNSGGIQLHHVVPKRRTPLGHGRILSRASQEVLEILRPEGILPQDLRRMQLPLCRRHHGIGDRSYDELAEALCRDPLALCAELVSLADKERPGILGEIIACDECGRAAILKFSAVEIIVESHVMAHLCNGCAPEGPR